MGKIGLRSGGTQATYQRNYADKTHKEWKDLLDVMKKRKKEGQRCMSMRQCDLKPEEIGQDNKMNADI